MIEIRTFEGDSGELAAFYASVWRQRYAGRFPVPIWPQRLFDWELFGDDLAAREYLVAAYDGGRLVGVLPAKPVGFQLHGRPVAGTWGSFFSVEPEYETRGVSLKLSLEQRRRHRDRGADIFMGFVYLGSSVAKGKEFWLRQKSVRILSKVGMWARLIDHRAVSDFEFSSRDRWATRLLGWVQNPPRAPSDAQGIRAYHTDDLADCLRLARRVSASADFGYDWTAAALSRQLNYRDVARTLVAEAEGRVEGFVNYCLVDVEGRRNITTAIIDLMSIEGLSPGSQRNLLRGALAQMAAEGAHVALLLRIAGYPARPLVATGFIPQPAEYYYVAQAMGPEVFTGPVNRLHVHWR